MRSGGGSLLAVALGGRRHRHSRTIIIITVPACVRAASVQPPWTCAPIPLYYKIIFHCDRLGMRERCLLRLRNSYGGRPVEELGATQTCTITGEAGRTTHAALPPRQTRACRCQRWPAADTKRSSARCERGAELVWYAFYGILSSTNYIWECVRACGAKPGSFDFIISISVRCAHKLWIYCGSALNLIVFLYASVRQSRYRHRRYAKYVCVCVSVRVCVSACAHAWSVKRAFSPEYLRRQLSVYWKSYRVDHCIETSRSNWTLHQDSITILFLRYWQHHLNQTQTSFTLLFSNGLMSHVSYNEHKRTLKNLFALNIILITL